MTTYQETEKQYQERVKNEQLQYDRENPKISDLI
jgi:hypothetical protein